MPPPIIFYVWNVDSVKGAKSLRHLTYSLHICNIEASRYTVLCHQVTTGCVVEMVVIVNICYQHWHQSSQPNHTTAFYSCKIISGRVVLRWKNFLLSYWTVLTCIREKSNNNTQHEFIFVVLLHFSRGRWVHYV